MQLTHCIVLFGLFQFFGFSECNAGIYLAINALAYTEDNGNGEIVKRRLEVNWYGDEVSSEDMIVLTTQVAPVASFSPIQYQDNFYIFEGNLPYPTLNEMGFERTCVFGYYITWYGADGSIKASNCLQSEPTWMQDNKDVLGSVSVGDLILTGSHDAGAYRDYQGIGDDNWGTHSVFAQEEDFLHQLIWGVRFLDVRAGFYPTTPERFWLVHSIIKAHPMIEGIDDVKEFLRNTQEIVVWEINSFEQVWTEDAHNEYKSLLATEFADWLVTPGEDGKWNWNTPLTDIWERDDLAEGQGRLIITYNVPQTNPTLFFREVKERWGNVDKPEDLYNYINKEVSNARGDPSYRPWKPNCQMTPNTNDIIIGGISLREFADAVNRNMTKWWREEWSDLTATFSIHDFVKSTNMVEETIKRNLAVIKNKM